MTNLVQVPDFEHGLAIMERVLKEAIPGWKCIVLTPEDRTVRQNKPLEQGKIVFPNSITDINWATRDCPRGSMELSTKVSRMEHVPIRVDKVAHPQTVVGTMHHVTTLKPKCAIGITRWISAPKIITYNKKKHKTHQPKSANMLNLSKRGKI